MKVERLSRLFQTLAQNSQTQEVSQSAEVSSNDEAVRVSAGFSGNATDVSASDREKRVAELKTQVASGSYRPDSTEVAKAVARDLFA